MLRPLKTIRAGSTVLIRVEVRDNKQSTRPLYTPTSVSLRLRNPLGALALDYTAMTAVDTGVYSYTHQTGLTNPLGTWVMDVRVVDSTSTSYTLPQDAFILVPTSQSA